MGFLSPSCGHGRCLSGTGAASSDNHGSCCTRLVPPGWDPLWGESGLPQDASEPSATFPGDGGSLHSCCPSPVLFPQAFLCVCAKAIVTPRSGLEGTTPGPGRVCLQTQTRLPRSLGNEHVSAGERNAKPEFDGFFPCAELGRWRQRGGELLLLLLSIKTSTLAFLRRSSPLAAGSG